MPGNADDNDRHSTGRCQIPPGKRMKDEKPGAETYQPHMLTEEELRERQNKIGTTRRTGGPTFDDDNTGDDTTPPQPPDTSD